MSAIIFRDFEIDMRPKPGFVCFGRFAHVARRPNHKIRLFMFVSRKLSSFVSRKIDKGCSAFISVLAVHTKSFVKSEVEHKATT